MQAILYIGHGSRVNEGVKQAIQFISQSMKSVDVPIQELCFLELSTPSITEGIQRCVQKGATKIAIVPVLLLTATHAKKDIPLEIEKARKRYPGVQFNYGRTLGVHSKIVAGLADRIYQQKHSIHEDAMVLFVGRGSSDVDAKRDFEVIARLLHQCYPVQRVMSCYLAAASPSFEEALDYTQRSGHKQVFVLPYLLFTGILMKRMEREIRKRRTSESDFVLCNCLGYHPNIQEVLDERIKETIPTVKTSSVV